METTLRRLNPSIPIYKTVRAQVDLSKVMGIGAYSERSPAFSDIVSRHIHGEEHGFCSNHDHEHPHEGQHLSPENQHAGISSIIVNIPGPLSDHQINSLDEWIRSALWENTIPSFDALDSDLQQLSIDPRDSQCMNRSPSELEILRCKGIWQDERGEQFMLQGVRNLYEVSKLPRTAMELDGPPTGKLVLIGKGLNKAVEGSLTRVVTSMAV